MSRPVSPTARLVILRALGLGDLLAAAPALRALAAAYPEHQRILAAPARLEPVASWIGATHRVVHTGPLQRLAPELGGADVAVNLHGRGPQSHHVLLAARPCRLIAFAHPDVPESAAGPGWRADEHEVSRWCRMLGAHGIPADPADLDIELPPAASAASAAVRDLLGAPDSEPPTIIHPGAANPARCWPPNRWAAVACAEADAGRTVLVTAGPREEPLAQAVIDAAARPGRVQAVPPGGLEQLAGLLAGAARIACADTGVAHLATALRVPSVVLFGPTPPSQWGPPPRSIHRVLWAGRSGSPHDPVPDPGLLAISPDDVISALAALPERAPA